MKNIESVNIWNNGSVEQATIFNLNIVSDDLETTAQFYFELKNSTLNTLTTGNLTINGQEYQEWDHDTSANEYAYNWAAEKLGLVIVSEYIQPE